MQGERREESRARPPGPCRLGTPVTRLWIWKTWTWLWLTWRHRRKLLECCRVAQKDRNQGSSGYQGSRNWWTATLLRAPSLHKISRSFSSFCLCSRFDSRKTGSAFAGVLGLPLSWGRAGHLDWEPQPLPPICVLFLVNGMGTGSKTSKVADSISVVLWMNKCCLSLAFNFRDVFFVLQKQMF